MAKAGDICKCEELFQQLPLARALLWIIPFLPTIPVVVAITSDWILARTSHGLPTFHRLQQAYCNDLDLFPEESIEICAPSYHLAKRISQSLPYVRTSILINYMLDIALIVSTGFFIDLFVYGPCLYYVFPVETYSVAIVVFFPGSVVASVLRYLCELHSQLQVCLTNHFRFTYTISYQLKRRRKLGTVSLDFEQDLYALHTNLTAANFH